MESTQGRAEAARLSAERHGAAVREAAQGIGRMAGTAASVVVGYASGFWRALAHGRTEQGGTGAE
jgi:hypothetical protein